MFLNNPVIIKKLKFVQNRTHMIITGAWKFTNAGPIMCGKFNTSKLTTSSKNAELTSEVLFVKKKATKFSSYFIVTAG